MKKVKFNFLNDVVTSGIKTNNNFIVSKDYISGSVLRNAFVWSILSDCPYAEEEYKDKKYYAAYRGEECDNCPKKEICKNFSDMKFSFLYPEGAIPIPFTLRSCKAYGTEHSVQDIIAQNGKLSCKECKGRMESAKGYINPETKKAVKVKRNTTIHTAIDRLTHTALEGSLYTIDAIACGNIYEGYIDDKGTHLADVGQVIYIGKYASCGFGKAEIIESVEYKPESCEAAVDRFNNKFKKAFNKENRLYASILFLSDAQLGLEECEGVPATMEEYKKQWHKRIFNTDIITLEQIYSQNFTYTGYDTSLSKSDYKATKIFTEKGTSVLISFEESKKDEVIKYLDSLIESGIGNETENGYGSIDVCNTLHEIGVDLGDK